MKFNTYKAERMYLEMFGDELDVEAVHIASAATDAQFEEWRNASQEDGNIPLSAGQLDCIDAARP